MSPAGERGGPSVSEMVERSGLQVDEHLRAFVEDELLAQVELTGEQFWSTLAGLQERFAPRIATALAERDDLQGKIDAWHAEHGAGSRDDYEKLLTDLGYLAPEPSSVPTIDVDRVDPEIAEVPGPQLVVPSTNARFSLNAANARWGSLFDAFYGTDALPAGPRAREGLRRAARRPGHRGRRRAARRAVPARAREPRRRHRLPPVDRRAGRRHRGRPGRTRRPVGVRRVQHARTPTAGATCCSSGTACTSTW